MLHKFAVQPAKTEQLSDCNVRESSLRAERSQRDFPGGRRGGGVVGCQQDYVHVTEVFCIEWRCSLCGYSTMGGAALCMDIALRVVLLFIWI